MNVSKDRKNIPILFVKNNNDSKGEVIMLKLIIDNPKKVLVLLGVLSVSVICLSIDRFHYLKDSCYGQPHLDLRPLN